MTAPVWTILVATLGRRGDQLSRRLLHTLMPQVDAAAGQVTVEALWNHGERPVCQVRQDLLDHATSAYTCFADDDDDLPAYYVAKVLPLLDGDVHYIGWRMRTWVNGFPLPPTSHSLRHGMWDAGGSDGKLRDISHLNPVRRDLTAGTSFCAGWPEDSCWSDQMRGRLLTERFIEDEMYFYRYNDCDSVQRDTGPWPGSWRRPVITSPHFSWHPASSPELVP